MTYDRCILCVWIYSEAIDILRQINGMIVNRENVKAGILLTNILADAV